MAWLMDALRGLAVSRIYAPGKFLVSLLMVHDLLLLMLLDLLLLLLGLAVNNIWEVPVRLSKPMRVAIPIQFTCIPMQFTCNFGCCITNSIVNGLLDLCGSLCCNPL